MTECEMAPAATPTSAASGDRYCLKWSNYGLNVTSSFKSLLANEELVDVSLSAQGKTLKAHKVVLSACSEYFRDTLQVGKI